MKNATTDTAQGIHCPVIKEKTIYTPEEYAELIEANS